MLFKEDKRTKILKASVKVFSQYGFHKAKIEDIAKEAGIGKGTIYEYFDSKKNLFIEMVEYCVIEYKNEIEKILSNDKNIEDKILSICKYHGKFIKEKIDMVQSIFSQSNILSKDMKTRLLKEKLEIFNLLRSIIKEGVDNGELRKDLDIDLATFSLIGTINQYYTQKILLEGISYEKITPNSIIDTLFRGFK